MSVTQSSSETPQRQLRLWPGVVIAILVLLLRLVVTLFAGDGKGGCIGELLDLDVLALKDLEQFYLSIRSRGVRRNHRQP